VTQALQTVTKIHCVCAMECNPEKGALGIRKLGKLVPSKSSWSIDF